MPNWLAHVAMCHAVLRSRVDGLLYRLFLPRKQVRAGLGVRVRCDTWLVWVWRQDSLIVTRLMRAFLTTFWLWSGTVVLCEGLSDVQLFDKVFMPFTVQCCGLLRMHK